MNTDPKVTYAEHVCVVVADETVDADQVRRILGDSMPLQILHWQQVDYVGTVQSLRPQVVVVVAQSTQTAQDSAMLFASLILSSEPTIASLAMADAVASPPDLLVHQLGHCAVARIASLADLRLP